MRRLWERQDLSQSAAQNVIRCQTPHLACATITITTNTQLSRSFFNSISTTSIDSLHPFQHTDDRYFFLIEVAISWTQEREDQGLHPLGTYLYRRQESSSGRVICRRTDLRISKDRPQRGLGSEFERLSRQSEQHPCLKSLLSSLKSCTKDPSQHVRGSMVIPLRRDCERCQSLPTSIFHDHVQRLGMVGCVYVLTWTKFC